MKEKQYQEQRIKMKEDLINIEKEEEWKRIKKKEESLKKEKEEEWASIKRKEESIEKEKEEELLKIKKKEEELLNEKKEFFELQKIFGKGIKKNDVACDDGEKKISEDSSGQENSEC